MYDNLMIFLSDGLSPMLLAGSQALLNDYAFIGVAIILLPIVRKLVNIFRSIY